MTLLIVEDNNRTRQMIKSLVADLATEIYECSDGAEAVAAYNAHQPDLVLMDIQMPVMNGLTATRQIITAWPDARIVIVTDYDDAEMRDAVVDAGACELVGKDNLLALRHVLCPGADAPSK